MPSTSISLPDSGRYPQAVTVDDFRANLTVAAQTVFATRLDGISDAH